jgi:hypothetical protein
VCTRAAFAYPSRGAAARSQAVVDRQYPIPLSGIGITAIPRAPSRSTFRVQPAQTLEQARGGFGGVARSLKLKHGTSRPGSGGPNASSASSPATAVAFSRTGRSGA